MAIMVFLGGCGGGPKGTPDTGGIEDAETVSVLETARHAFLAGRYDQATTVYTRALDRAYRLDDVAAIAVAGQELALSELRRGKAADAAAVAARSRSELLRRGRSVPTALTLVEATAHYRLGDAQKTRQLAREITESSKDVLVTARATYLIGLIAADQGDRTALQDAIEKLPASEEPELAADRLALTGRLASLDGDVGTALAAFTAEEKLRRANGDEVGVARALESAARAAESGGRLAEAADLYFRAGRSASLAGPVGSGAAALLRRAEHLARRTGQPGLAAEAGRLRLKLVRP
ncbi:hypothetical protein [Azospirillum sp. TSO22-1]|uniref:hypothetical protein n=1 Tax=Azospirillum sp. TSO22-1 TaxID=716789 RepID=UPI000D61B46A|nr:hypothetical protein [Azospirillum sp. TSO22-1]PWC53805.1 hypothetical protein TSO221_09805 [Azospirillum sp. TSO22-1]